MDGPRTAIVVRAPWAHLQPDQLSRKLLLEQEDPVVLRNMRRTWPECTQFVSWLQAEKHLQDQLDEMRATLKRVNVQQWRARMNKRGLAATKWLNAKPASMPRFILKADGSKTSCATESCQELSAFWRCTWGRLISAEVRKSFQSESGAS